jgi:hypothetical protein
MAKHRTTDERRKIVAAWRASGLSAWKYCDKYGVAQASLQRWAAQVGAVADKPPAGFVRLELPTARTTAGLVVEIGGARVLVGRGFDSELLRQLVVALSGEAS